VSSTAKTHNSSSVKPRREKGSGFLSV
jgi:hypothetical protein